MKKLDKVAHEQDKNGCWVEPSARVRAAARNALRACERVQLPVAPLPGDIIELPPEEKAKRQPTEAPRPDAAT